MYEDDEPESLGQRLRKVALWILIAGAMVAAVVVVMRFVEAPAAKKTGVQQIALIKPPPPPPPPPKPPEKPPEPPKVKEEVKIDQPKDEPKPDEPKAADEKPASDKPLALDADGSAGSDGFGLAASRGGRDLLTTGSGGGVGGGGAYYSGLLQREFFEALQRNRKLLKDEFRVVVKVWLGDDGRVQKADIVTSSGNTQFDDQIQLTLLEMNPLRDVPPKSMRPIQLRLSNRS